jgi:hypothetical protein
MVKAETTFLDAGQPFPELRPSLVSGTSLVVPERKGDGYGKTTDYKWFRFCLNQKTFDN